MAAVAGGLVAGVAVVVSVFAFAPSRSTVTITTNPAPSPGLAPSTAVPGPARPIPALFVAGNNNGGIGVYSTATGQLVRTVAEQTSGGPDQQAMLSTDGRTVFFSQPNGACNAAIDTVPVSGDRPPIVAVSAAETMAIEPAPNRSDTRLAWVGVSCTTPYPATLWVTDLATGARTDLGPFTGDRTDDGLSWDSTGTRLAVENGTGLAVVNAEDPDALAHADRLAQRSGCTLTDPAYLPGANQLAAIQTCRATGSSVAVTLDATTGRQLSRIATAKLGSRFVSLSVDRSGQNILLGLQSKQPISAAVVRAENGQLITLSRTAPTGDEW
jgi:hypothetical protein